MRHSPSRRRHGPHTAQAHTFAHAVGCSRMHTGWRLLDDRLLPCCLVGDPAQAVHAHARQFHQHAARAFLEGRPRPVLRRAQTAASAACPERRAQAVQRVRAAQCCAPARVDACACPQPGPVPVVELIARRHGLPSRRQACPCGCHASSLGSWLGESRRRIMAAIEVRGVRRQRDRQGPPVPPRRDRMPRRAPPPRRARCMIRRCARCMITPCASTAPRLTSAVLCSLGARR